MEMSNIKDEMEEGEISDASIEDEPLGQYTPLERPITLNKKPTSGVQSTEDYDSDDDNQPSFLPPGLKGSDDDSDSDEEKPRAKQARGSTSNGAAWGKRRDALVPPADGGGDTFRKMAEAFQADRDKKGLNKSKRNNVWGSIIQEESLNSEMAGTLGVGRRLKDLGSDRGAETYDFTLIEKERREERAREKQDEKKGAENTLDSEMESYWAREAVDTEEMDETKETSQAMEDNIKQEIPGEDIEKRGIKRSVKERLGEKRFRMDRYRNEVLPSPGEPRTIVDIDEQSLVEGTDKDFGIELAERLMEEKEDMIVELVKLVGRKTVFDFFKQTQEVEGKGGLVINNGARRRTPGGVMLHLMRKCEDEEIGAKVRHFLNQSNNAKRKILAAKSKKKKQQKFEDEMAEFLKMNRSIADKEKEVEMEEVGEEIQAEDIEDEKEETLLPLPNIL